MLGFAYGPLRALSLCMAVGSQSVCPLSLSSAFLYNGPVALDRGEGIPRFCGDWRKRPALPSVGGGMAPITPGLTASPVNWGHDSGVLGLL